jgi:hypothetical protein
MKCNDSQNLIMKYFDRELNDIEDAQLKQHIRVCKHCSDEFESLKEIFNAVEQQQDIEPPEDFERQVMYRIKNETVMYEKNTVNNNFVYGILLAVLSFVFVISIGGAIFESLQTPVNVMQFFGTASDYLKDFFSAAVSTGRGIVIAIVGVAASIYKTYYYAYIVMGVILFMILKVFFRILKSGNWGTVMEECNE